MPVDGLLRTQVVEQSFGKAAAIVVAGADEQELFHALGAQAVSFTHSFEAGSR